MSKKKQPKQPAAPKTAAAGSASVAPRWSAVMDLLWALPYAAALFWLRDTVPDGLNNDAAEEALRGLYLLEQRKFEVITFSIGNSAETLYLYLVGAAAKVLGPTTLAIQLPSWLVGAASIWLLIRVVRRLDASTPPWASSLLGISSVWLFHYVRAGLRAVAAPFFLLSFWLLLDRAERLKEDRWSALGCGAVLGLSLYAYTSCRVLPAIFVVYALIRVMRATSERPRLLRCYAFVALGAFLISLPNLWFFIRSPGEFLFRGSYVLRGGAWEIAANTLWSFLLPFSFYRDVYRDLGGAAHYFDGVSAGLTVAGINPIHPLVAAAFAAGLWRLWKTRHEPGAMFILIAWLCATLILGIAGPSLTRMLILLPVYLAVASVGIGTGAKRSSAFGLALAAVLLALTLQQGYAYFFQLSSSKLSSLYFSSAATPIGQRAVELAAQGERVLCVISKDAAVIRFLTHAHPGDVHVVEFYNRPLVVEEIPLKEFNPSTLLIEKQFAGYANTFPPQRLRQPARRFDEIDLKTDR